MTQTIIVDSNEHDSHLGNNSVLVNAQIDSPLLIGATGLRGAEAGVPYSGNLNISGGLAPYRVTIMKGILPAGLQLESTGIISGIPAAASKRAAITFNVQDSAGASVSRQFVIPVAKALTISGTTLKGGRVGKNYSAKIKAKGGSGPLAWSLWAGNLPQGFSLNPVTGVITGIASAPGIFAITVKVTDLLGGSYEQSFSLTIT